MADCIRDPVRDPPSDRTEAHLREPIALHRNTSPHLPEATMSPRLYLGLVPWIVFMLVGRGSLEGAAWGAATAMCVALALVAMSVRTRSVKDLEVFAVVLFAGLALWGASDQNNPSGFLQRYHNGIATGALALFAISSLAFQPFTEPYAREVVQRKYWKTTRFARANVELTLLWSLVFAAIAASQMLAGAIDTRLGSTVFTWVVPLGIALLGVKQATTRWDDQFDGESMTLDAMLNQGELWDTNRPNRPGGPIERNQF
jgi:hypothetical protein